MLLDAFKIFGSLLPLIKEAFLWRDGAEEGKPITKQNLIRRKIAVFVMLGSLIFNYVIAGKVVDLYDKSEAKEQLITELKQEKELLKQDVNALREEVKAKRMANCLTPMDVVKMVQDEMHRTPSADDKKNTGKPDAVIQKENKHERRN